MAQYKVLQDIEAEDKLLGPLSLRQFIYAALVIVLGFIGFQLARVGWFLALPFLPPMVFFGLLAAPFGQNQSSEIWLLAKIKFFLFPKRRIWDQSGLQELVKITVPKKIEEHLTKGFSQDEVKSRLQALANTLDTRGWAIKNISPDVYQRSAAVAPVASDRLVAIETMPQDVPVIETPTSDVLDTESNPVAQKMSSMLAQSDQTHREELLLRVRTLADQQRAQQVQQAKAAATPPLVPAAAPPATVVSPQALPQAPAVPSAPQPILSHAGQALNDLNEGPPMPTGYPVIPFATAPKKAQEKAQAPMTTPPKTAKLEGVKDKGSNSLDISHGADDNSAPDEVVISLH